MVATFLLSALILTQGAVTNGSFEKSDGDRPASWRSQTWAGKASFRHDTKARTGKYSVLVESSEGVDGGWQAQLAVKPYSKYKLTAWIKTEGVEKVDGQGALINLHTRSEKTVPISGTQDWKQVSLDIETGADDVIVVNCLLGYYGRAKGKAWFDDIEMTLLETRPLNPTATIDATKKFEPISPYIYSQFIEHMGKCIYGGIWAEMLEDRKFYHVVGSKESPWRARGKVSMSKVEPFVGDHSPVVETGLRQPDLWIQKAREYTGYVWVRADGKDATVSVSLTTNQMSRAMHRVISNVVKVKAAEDRWVKAPFAFKATEDDMDAEFDIECDVPVRIGTASLMPADNVKGMRRDTLGLLKELNAPLYRWPGGNFVSGYDWRDGIGDRDKRPPRKNPAWQGIEHNDFGTHEFLEFCKEVKTEPLIVVNTGFGDAHSAAAWLQYVNGAASTEEGRRRLSNGRTEPWSVKWWGIGNEMYGDWQLGHIPLEQYMVKHNIFFDRMTKVDPNILTIASSDLGNNWSKGMLENCPMTLISEHFYCQEKPGVAAHVAQIPNAIRAKVAAHRKLRDSIPGLKEKGIKIAMDEWNYWYGPHVFGELGTRYFVKDGLGIAAGLHEFYRSTDMVGMAQYAQTVNVIGAIKTNPVAAAFETTGLVLKLYRQEFGVLPVEVTGSPEPLDVSAALTADGKFLTIAVVNPTAEAVTIPLTWKGISIADSGQRWEIAHPDPMAHNDPGKPDVIRIVKLDASGLSKSVTLKPYSATLFKVART